MTTPATDPQPVTSKLWKFVQLTSASSYFPRLVEGAARYEHKPYGPELVAHVAAQDTVLDAIELTIQNGAASPVDPVLERLMLTNGATVDQVILDAVAAYQEGAS